MTDNKTFLMVNAIPNTEDMASEAFNAFNDLRKKAYKQEVDLMICEAL